jgi:hypothetical protein
MIARSGANTGAAPTPRLWPLVAAALAACALSDGVALSRGHGRCADVAGLSGELVLSVELVLLALIVAVGVAAWRKVKDLGPETGANGIATHTRRMIARAALVLSLFCFCRQMYRFGALLLAGGCG